MRVVMTNSNLQDDWDKMVSDATFFFLVADQKKGLIKVSLPVLSCQ